MAPEKAAITVRPRIRITRGEVIVIGPGKADLLEAIARTGSIRAGAAELGMSYMRAWKLVRTMNEQFTGPLVEKARGGPHRGGARLTPLGEQVASVYRKMEAAALKAIRPSLRSLRSKLR